MKIAMFEGYGEPPRSRRCNGRGKLVERVTTTRERVRFDGLIADVDHGIRHGECGRALKSLLEAHSITFDVSKARRSLAQARGIFRRYCRVSPRM
ncbi:hypothetical protein [Anaeromyxobacter oryzisoli]|uniref:hypothetical protein n=1 Tax=Anaeromyxobacter oryzisoli TaxID=2925408 RepID=UPI001F59BCDA|nr:hypothetical protein [Anaeromyxobacter sp. SG63]